MNPFNGVGRLPHETANIRNKRDSGDVRKKYVNINSKPNSCMVMLKRFVGELHKPDIKSYTESKTFQYMYENMKNSSKNRSVFFCALIFEVPTSLDSKELNSRIKKQTRFY